MDDRLREEIGRHLDAVANGITVVVVMAFLIGVTLAAVILW